MKIYDRLINYQLVSSFKLENLQKSLILPIDINGMYLECFICKGSNLEQFDTNQIIRSYEVERSEIEFFLSYMDIRINLYKYSKRTLNNELFDDKSMENFFDIFIKNAIDCRSSDIHIESLENLFIVRFRIDGILKLFHLFEKRFFFTLSSYIKMKSKLDITNNRLPQDGRFSYFYEDRKFDFRVSSMPTITGESIVIRILDTVNVTKDISNLGFSFHILDEIKNIIKLKEGLVLITGPTGSGKSTTLYSLIKKFDNQNKKIITVEDPVEYKLENIQQIQVNESIQLGFDTILKNILRQDPDIILIGEIRDEFSLNIALQASLTGHLVLASIHANSSIETVSRLLDLKADRFLLATTLKYVFSQRLILKICEECNLKGCKRCNFTGFYDRSSIGEILKIDNKIKSFILSNEYEKKIQEYLDSINFKSMLDDGKLKVENKVTTIKEVYKVVSF